MFRSGTTLLGRMLHAHPSVAVASDPYRPVFNFFRSQIARELSLDVPPSAPLGDYYFDPQRRRLFKAIQKSSLEKPIKYDIDSIRSEAAKHGKPLSPRIADNINQLTGATWSELLGSMLRLIRGYYGSNSEQIIGFKEVWTDEFVPLLCRSEYDFKCIHIVRDPRAVSASKNVGGEGQYPWWFLGRQWRKLASLARTYSGNMGFSDRVFVLRFEDLVANPGETTRKICHFLGVSVSDAMTDPSRYVDGRGDEWRQNTNYGEGQEKFDTGAIDRWRSHLQPQEVRAVESLCWPEMTLYDYKCDYRPSSPDPLECPYIEGEDLADWMQGSMTDGLLMSAIKAAEERIRYRLLQKEDSGVELIEGAFLRRDLYENMREKVEV